MTPDALLPLTLHLADNALVLAQRNAEWSGHGPALEEDIALSNQSLDLLGQARMLYQLAAQLEGGGKTEDHYAYFRDASAFTNFTLCELPHSAPSVGYAPGARDYAITITRNFFYSAHMLCAWPAVAELAGADAATQTLRAISGKSLKEARYHFRHSRDWLIKLGDGTAASHARMQSAVHYLAPFTLEFASWLAGSALSSRQAQITADYQALVTAALSEAGLQAAPTSAYAARGSNGVHSEHLSFLLAEMQSLARAHPQAVW